MSSKLLLSQAVLLIARLLEGRRFARSEFVPHLAASVGEGVPNLRGRPHNRQVSDRVPHRKNSAHLRARIIIVHQTVAIVVVLERHKV